MNYLYRIAFLGKKQLPWVPNRSNWKLVKPFGSRVWTDEFCQLKRIGPTDSVLVALDLYPDNLEFNMSVNDKWSPDASSYEMFHREDGDILYINNRGMHARVDVPATLEYLNNMSVEDIKKLEGQDLPPELLKS